MKIHITKEWLLKMVAKGEGEIGAGWSPTESECFDAWFLELTAIMRLNGFSKSSIETVDKEAFRFYFDDQYTPAGALDEDLSNA